MFMESNYYEPDTGRSTVTEEPRLREQRRFVPESSKMRIELTMPARPLMQAFISASVVVLAILGLSGVYPLAVATIATIAFGVVSALEGSAIGGRIYDVDVRKGEGTLVPWAGLSSELVGGVTGLVLGILALLGVVPGVLIAVAATLFGLGMLFGGAAKSLISDLNFDKDERVRAYAWGAAYTIPATYTRLGLGIATLGVLALAGVQPMILTLVALLILGFSGVASGAHGREVRRG
jgi:hypothetical protein